MQRVLLGLIADVDANCRGGPRPIQQGYLTNCITPVAAKIDFLA
jgi:hypothetical protein